MGEGVEETRDDTFHLHQRNDSIIIKHFFFIFRSNEIEMNSFFLPDAFNSLFHLNIPAFLTHTQRKNFNYFSLRQPQPPRHSPHGIRFVVSHFLFQPLCPHSSHLIWRAPFVVNDSLKDDFCIIFFPSFFIPLPLAMLHSSHRKESINLSIKFFNS